MDFQTVTIGDAGNAIESAISAYTAGGESASLADADILVLVGSVSTVKTVRDWLMVRAGAEFAPAEAAEFHAWLFRQIEPTVKSGASALAPFVVLRATAEYEAGRLWEAAGTLDMALALDPEESAVLLLKRLFALPEPPAPEVLVLMRCELAPLLAQQIAQASDVPIGLVELVA